MTIRKSVRNLSQEELANLRFAYSHLMEIPDNRGYRYLAGIHGIPHFKCKHAESEIYADPNFRLFLPWHRAYLKWLEDHLRDFDSTVAQCWWDWTSDLSHSEGIPKAYSEENVNGSANPLYKFHISEPGVNTNGLPPSDPIDEDTFRDPRPLSLLPTPQDVENLLSLEDFVYFSKQLENIHDRIHGWVGGSMSDIGTAAFDPIFYAHHTNIDRIWYMWQIRHGNSTIPSDWLDLSLAPFPYTFRQVMDISTLGYDYATISAEVFIR
jgi:tyrosinase